MQNVSCLDTAFESAQAASEAEEALLRVVLEQVRVVQHSLATQAHKALQLVHDWRRLVAPFCETFLSTN